MFLEPLAGDRDAHQSEIGNRPLQFADHRCSVVDGVLKRQQADRFQSRIGFTDIGDKVVLGAAIGNCVGEKYRSLSPT